MNLSDVALFAEVAHAGSFSAVARARGIDPSAVGRVVAGLEAELGLRLLERTTRTMRLTEAGDLWLGRVRPLLEEFARATADAQSATARPQGVLRLSASVTFGQRWIVPRLSAFHRRWPAVVVEGVFTDANLDLVAERIDLAVRLAPEVEGDLIVAKLMDTRYRVVASPGYLAGAPPLEEPADLARHRAVLFDLRPFRTRWLFRDGAGRLAEQPVSGDVVLSPAGAVLDATLASLGPAMLPDWLVDDEVAAGRLRRLLGPWAVTATTFDTAAWLVYPSRAYLPAKTRAMIDVLREG